MGCTGTTRLIPCVPWAGLSVVIVVFYVISLVRRAISSLSSTTSSRWAVGYLPGLVWPVACAQAQRLLLAVFARSSKTSKAVGAKPSKDNNAKAAAAAAEDR